MGASRRGKDGPAPLDQEPGRHLFKEDLMKVVPGEIRISSIDLVADYDNAKVWEIDCDSKYPNAYSGATHEGDSGSWLMGRNVTYDVNLIADERTLRIDESRKGAATGVILDELEGEWSVQVTVGKYMVYVLAYRRGEDSGEVWRAED
jgi:hypothetical protein